MKKVLIRRCARLMILIISTLTVLIYGIYSIVVELSLSGWTYGGSVAGEGRCYCSTTGWAAYVTVIPLVFL